MTQYRIFGIERADLKEALDEVRKLPDEGIERAYACRKLIDLVPPAVIQMMFDRCTADRNGPESGCSTPDALCYIIDNGKAYGA
jgi:hypothetical protein